MGRLLRARILGASFLGAAVVAGYFSAWGAALALALTGAALVILVTERDIPPELPDDAARGLVASLARITRDLHLEGHGIIVPGLREDSGTLFIPARKGAGLADLPPVSASSTLHRDGVGALGVASVPPGSGLGASWVQSHGYPEGRGLEEATVHIRQAFAALGLGTDVVVARAGTHIRVTYVPQAFSRTCEAAREAHAPWHLQGGCPACSFIMILMARAHSAPVRFVDAGTDGQKVTLDLEVGERSPA